MSGQKSLAPFRPLAVADLIRVGRDGDGGYVISERSCASAGVVVGLGIETDWSFEAAFLERNPRARAVGVDGSVSREIFRNRGIRSALGAAVHAGRGRFRTARERVAESRECFRHARALESFFGSRGRFIDRFIGERDTPVSLSWRSLRAAVAAVQGRSEPADVFVKMDIEGAEYRVLPEVLEDSEVITGMAIEFHDLDLLWERFAELMARMEEDFAVVHLHGNNYLPLIAGTAIPRTLEVSVMHRRLLADVDRNLPPRAYPLEGLDQPNAPNRPDYPLEFGQPEQVQPLERGRRVAEPAELQLAPPQG
jgi:hypothetical protein